MTRTLTLKSNWPGGAGSREFKESPIYQGEDEIMAYTFDTTPSGSTTPASPSTVIKNAAGTDVSGTNLTGSDSVSAPNITTADVTSLTAGAKYRLEVSWTESGETYEAFGYIFGQE